MPPTSQGLMPSVGDTQLLTVCIKTFNAQFLKQKQSKNSRQDCCSYYEKGHSAGTKSTRISLLVAISEQHSLFKGYLFIRPLLSIFNSWPSQPASSSQPHLQSPRVFGTTSFLMLCFPAPTLLVNGIRHPAFIHLFKQVLSPLHNNIFILLYCI